MPTDVISGFVAGDSITLDAQIYSAGDTVAVHSAGIVTISAGGTTYNLHIAGATVGETDFTLGGYVLTLTKSASAPAARPALSDTVAAHASSPAKMAFLAPPASASAAAPAKLPDLAAVVSGGAITAPFAAPAAPLSATFPLPEFYAQARHAVLQLPVISHAGF